jgi:hypothetical protein
VAGAVASVLVVQDCNMGGEYLRYYFHHDGKACEVVPVDLVHSPDLPFVSLNKSATTEVTVPHPTGRPVHCRREAEYVYRFTLKEKASIAPPSIADEVALGQ